MIQLTKSRYFLQVLALILAVATWFAVNSGKIVRESRQVKLQYVQIPKGLIFQRTPLRELKVELSGPLSRIRSMDPDSLVYVVDLSSSKEGSNRIEVDPEMLKLPLDVEVLNLSPRFFNLYLEELFTKSVPVRVNPLGQPKEGFQVKSLTVKPEELSVTGPRTVVSKLVEIPVDVSLFDKDASFFETLKPRLSFPDVEVLTSVTIEVEVASIKSTREFMAVPVVLKGGKGVVSPPVARVVIESGTGDLDKLGALQIVVSVEGLKRGRYRLRGELPLSGTSKLVLMDPTQFLVEKF